MATKALLSDTAPFRLTSALAVRGQRWYSRPGEQNLVGIQTSGTVSGRFNDLMMAVIRRPDGLWQT